MIRLISIVVIILLYQAVNAQNGDSLLLNETTLSRPLNVHKKQIRISGDYFLALSSAQFIGSDKVEDSGRTRTFSGFNIDIRYGITEFLQVRMNLRRSSEVIIEPALFDAFGADFFILNSSVEEIGFGDPEIWLDYRIPFLGPRTDLVINVGGSLPLTSTGENQPGIQDTPSIIDFFEGIDFRNVNRIKSINTGNGVPRLGYGFQFKHRFKRTAFNLQSSYLLPLKTSTEDRWVPSDTGFDETIEIYERQIPDNLFISGSFEIQMRPWLNVAVGTSYFRSRYGWNETEGQKLAIPEAILSQASFTYEIIATKNLWLGQTLNFNLSAENIYSPLLLTTAVKYNFFL